MLDNPTDEPVRKQQKIADRLRARKNLKEVLMMKNRFEMPDDEYNTISNFKFWDNK